MNLSQLRKNKLLVWFLGAATAVLLSVIGNGVWEVVARPVLRTAARWVLDVASLGLHNYKNSVYAQIARDNHTAATIHALLLTIFVFIIVAISVLLFGVRRFAELKWRIQSRFKMIQKREPRLENPPPPDILLKIGARRLRTITTGLMMLYASMVMYGTLFILEVVSVAKLTYIDSADSYYHHVVRIASPYFDQRELLQLDSEFSQTANKADYIRVISKLEQRCRERGCQVPKFDPW